MSVPHSSDEFHAGNHPSRAWQALARSAMREWITLMLGRLVWRVRAAQVADIASTFPDFLSWKLSPLHTHTAPPLNRQPPVPMCVALSLLELSTIRRPGLGTAAGAEAAGGPQRSHSCEIAVSVAGAGKSRITRDPPCLRAAVARRLLQWHPWPSWPILLLPPATSECRVPRGA